MTHTDVWVDSGSCAFPPTGPDNPADSWGEQVGGCEDRDGAIFALVSFVKAQANWRRGRTDCGAGAAGEAIYQQHLGPLVCRILCTRRPTSRHR